MTKLYLRYRRFFTLSMKVNKTTLSLKVCMLNSCACAGVTRYNKSDENRINCYRQLLGIFLSLSSHIFLKIPLAAYLLMVTKMLTGEWWSISTGENFEGLILLRSHQSFARAETISSLKFVSVLKRNCENWTVSETVKKLYKRNCLQPP